jgi:hypothetical protein
LDGIEYVAFDGCFYRVVINNPNPFLLAPVFGQMYGVAKTDKSGNSRYWNWEADEGQTSIGMSYSTPSEIFPDGFKTAYLVNNKLEEESQVILRREAMVELNKAKKDF